MSLHPTSYARSASPERAAFNNKEPCDLCRASTDKCPPMLNLARSAPSTNPQIRVHSRFVNADGVLPHAAASEVSTVLQHSMLTVPARQPRQISNDAETFHPDPSGRFCPVHTHVGHIKLPLSRLTAGNRPHHIPVPLAILHTQTVYGLSFLQERLYPARISPVYRGNAPCWHHVTPAGSACRACLRPPLCDWNPIAPFKSKRIDMHSFQSYFALV